MEQQSQKLTTVSEGDGVILDIGTRKIQWLRNNLKGNSGFLRELKPSQCNRTKLVPLIGQECYDQIDFYVYSREGTLQILPKERALEGVHYLSSIADLFISSAKREDDAENIREWCKRYKIFNCFNGIYSIRDPRYDCVEPIADSKKVGNKSSVLIGYS